MSQLISYSTPQDYLNATEDFLLQNELENNLILGLCYGFPDRAKQYQNCVFINVMENNEVQSTSIKTWLKAIVSGKTNDSLHIKPLAEYYRNNRIEIAGAFGETYYAEQFASFYNKPELDRRTMLVHKLTSVNKLPKASGNMVSATLNDLEFITDWIEQFEEDAGSYPKKKREEILQSAKVKLTAGDIFKWIDNGEPVSMAGIVRKTKNLGIVGPVYTPAELRGKGYATSCVQQLSEYILQKGYQYCGLFTDKANPTSNDIYKKIGYVPATEFSDIEFVQK